MTGNATIPAVEKYEGFPVQGPSGARRDREVFGLYFSGF